MKRFLHRFVTISLVALCCGLMLGFVGCGENDANAIKKDLSQQLNSFKELDEKTLAQFGKELNDSFNQIGITSDEFFSALAERFSYTIGEVKVDGEKATVQCEIESLDFKSVSDIFDEDMKLWVSNENIASMTQEELYVGAGALFLAAMEDANAQTTKTNVTFEYTKSNGEWTVTDAGELEAALYGTLADPS